MGLRLITGPAVEPLTLAEAKTHLRVDLGDEDALIDTLITVARQYAETFTGRLLATQTWDWTLDRFPACNTEPLMPPLYPVQSVTYIQYVDTNGQTQIWGGANYTVDTASVPARIQPVYAGTWPSTRAVPNAVTVRLVAGYGLEPAIPAAIKQGMLMTIGHLYAHRESVMVGATATEVPQATDWLLWPYRVFYP